MKRTGPERKGLKRIGEEWNGANGKGLVTFTQEQLTWDLMN